MNYISCLIDLTSLWPIDGIIVFTISVLVTGILIPRILLISFRRKLFDLPDERKLHQGAVPRLGGMAFMPAIVFSLAIVSGGNMLLFSNLTNTPQSIHISEGSVELCFGLCALMAVYLVGLADDLIGVKYRAKFVVQIFAAILLVASGMTIDNLDGFLGIHEISQWIAVPLTILVVVLIINAINLIDGIDGLASGLSAIALAFYAAIAFEHGLYVIFLVALAALGTLLPFFYYNVFGDPKVGKKIFMGDTGALTTGLTLSFLAIKLSRIEPSPYDEYAMPLVLGFAPLVVPCLDVVRVFFHRIRRGHSPFLPGRTHIHHKFLAIGFSQRVAMITILLISAALITVDMLLSPELPIILILAIDLGAWILLNLWLSRTIRNRATKNPEICKLYN